MLPRGSGVTFEIIARIEGTRDAPAARLPGAKYSAVICGASPAAPKAMRQRVTPRYFPISAAVANRSSRGVDWRYIRRLISAIAARSRRVSAAGVIGAVSVTGDPEGSGVRGGYGDVGRANLRGAPLGHQLARSYSPRNRSFLSSSPAKSSPIRSSLSTALDCREYWRNISTCTIKSSSVCWARASSETAPAEASDAAPEKLPARDDTVAALAARERTFCKKEGSTLPSSFAMRSWFR